PLQGLLQILSPQGRSTVRSAGVAVLLLLVFSTVSVDAQTKRKTAHKRKSPPCRVGCQPDTTAPDVLTASADDAAANRELGVLARDLHNGLAGSYDKLSAFAARHASDIYGARAALALGYEEYQNNHVAQALVWLNKAQKDELLKEYAL